MSEKNSKKITYHKRIISILSDGGWHSFSDLFKAVSRFVSPETADKEYKKRHPNWKQVKESVRVLAGRRRLIWLSLNSAIHHAKTVTARGRAADRKFRLSKKALATPKQPRKAKVPPPVSQNEHGEGQC